MSSVVEMQPEVAFVRDDRLKNFADWNASIAKYLAAKEALALTETHWQIIHLMRDYYQAYNISPITKLLLKEYTKKYQRPLSVAELDQLFPGGIQVQATRISGLPIAHLDAELDPQTTPAPTATETETTTRQKPASHFVGSFQFEQQTYTVCRHGNLIENSAWTEAMAAFLAHREGITLTSEHWEVIQFLRNFYFSYGITPMVRLLMRHMAERLGKEKASEKYLYTLFPGGPSRQGSRFAGLPAPQGCID